MTTLEADGVEMSLAGSDRIERVAAALRSHNIEAIIVDTGEEARNAVLEMIPVGSEVPFGQVEDTR